MASLQSSWIGSKVSKTPEGRQDFPEGLFARLARVVGMESVKGGVTGNIHECALDGYIKLTSVERPEQSKTISTSLNLQDRDDQKD